MPAGLTEAKEISRLKWILTRKENYIRRLERLVLTECECPVREKLASHKERYGL